MGTLVLVNFMMVVTWFPAVVLKWHRMGLEAACNSNVEPKPHWLEHFCEHRFAPTVLERPKRRLLVIIVSLMIVAIFLIFAVQLQPSDKDFRAETFYDDTNIMRALNANDQFAQRG